MHESDSREVQYSLGWSTFQDHPHIWGKLFYNVE